jgi:5-methylcytosine-specific restriction endonuclease McrA
MGRSNKSSGIGNIKNWNAIRKAVLSRDNYACRICHKDGAEAKLNVHHKEYDRSKNNLRDLVTLCQTCHRAVHAEGYKPSLYEDWPIPWGEDGY